LDINKANRHAQAEAIAQWSHWSKDPVILAGDFNAHLNEWEMTPLRRAYLCSSSGFGPATFPTRQPEKTIDYFFYNRSFLQYYQSVAMDVITQANASDHLPLLTIWKPLI
jgi:endonuclease/exonuclease/phosphatase family metal-dependent hydrolase